MDPDAGATINPDPAHVGVRATVCYDFGGSRYVLFRLTDATTLKVKYVSGQGGCADIAESLPEADDTWATYVR